MIVPGMTEKNALPLDVGSLLERGGEGAGGGTRVPREGGLQ